MALRVERRRMGLLASCVLAVPVLALVLAQVFLPTLAAHRVRARVARYGTVSSVSVSAFPAIKLLWGKADSVSVHARSLSISPPQLASLLWEAHDIHTMAVLADAATLRPAALPNGLALSDVRMEKHGSTVTAKATLTQQQLDDAFPSGFRVEPVASSGGQIEARASGGLFGLQASISALVRPAEGRLIAEPHGLPFADLATVTLFSDPRLRVRSVGLSIERTNPLTYGLSLRASLLSAP
jgi:LmeA-like phospholipid-binding